ncbi:hypothetical protein [Massilia rhizosphaerae]|uniref:hypothetical protein n=1 Tax=Massilia rhizosphaerae TaxID=2784389 RepID=UPI0018DDCB7C|nr:hypothetical protein [Massilia rhizosphaerae]
MTIDWVAEMFAALRDCGENIAIVFGEEGPRAADGKPRWCELPHDRYDGVSGLAQLLADGGAQAGRLPEWRGDRFTLFTGLRGLLSVLHALPVRRQQWKSAFHWTRAVAFLPAEQRVAWRFFTQEETARIVAAAKAAGATVNSYLLCHLDRAVSAELVAPGAPRRWMVPVNLRGAVTRPSPQAPHMSFFGVDLEGDVAPRAVQQRVDRLRRRRYHWGMWMLLHLGRLLGKEGMRNDIRKRERQKHGVTGMFSNLGSWTVDGAGSWLFCPAITRVYPIGAGCVTMNGRMALALQLHEALGRDVHCTWSLLNAWSGACLPHAAADAPSGPVEARLHLVS